MVEKWLGSMMPSLLAVSKRQRPWESPHGHVVVGRRWKYAPPPWVMYEALVDEHPRWLSLLTDELRPEVVASQRPTAVIYQPWVDPRISAVEVRIEPPERPNTGAALTVLAYADQEALLPEERRWVRYRLGTLFGAALREWVDEPHW
jgi:hypothetical protein